MSPGKLGYQAYADGGKAFASGLPRSSRVYMDDKYLRKSWLDGWDATHAFRQQNLKMLRPRIKGREK
jgi:hypothetical protein